MKTAWTENLRRPRREDGFTLAETIVYVLLLAIISVIIISFMVTMLRANMDIAGSSSAMNRSQTYMDRVELSVRNAADAQVKVYPDGSSVLLTQTRSTVDAVSSDVQFCRAFFYDASDKSLKYVQRPVSPTAIWNLSSDVPFWRNLQWNDRVTHVALLHSAPAGTSAFGLSNNVVTTGYSIADPRAKKSVEIHTSTQILARGSAEGKCFQ